MSQWSNAVVVLCEKFWTNLGLPVPGLFLNISCFVEGKESPTAGATGSGTLTCPLPQAIELQPKITHIISGRGYMSYMSISGDMLYMSSGKLLYVIYVHTIL